MCQPAMNTEYLLMTQNSTLSSLCQPQSLLDCVHTVMMAVWGMNCTWCWSDTVHSAATTSTECKPVFRQIDCPNNASVFQSGRLWGHLGLCFVLFDAARCFVTPVLVDRPNRYCRDKLCFAVATTWLQLCCLLLLFVLLSYLAALLMTILVKHAYGTKEPS